MNKKQAQKRTKIKKTKLPLQKKTNQGKNKKNQKNKILVFGNPFFEADSIALQVAEVLKKSKINGFYFEFVNSPEELGKFGKNLLIMDSAKGLQRVQLIKGLDCIQLAPRFTTHDFDLAFNLKLLKKTKRISSIAFIAIPQEMQLQEAVFSAAKLLEKLKV